MPGHVTILSPFVDVEDLDRGVSTRVGEIVAGVLLGRLRTLQPAPLPPRELSTAGAKTARLTVPD